MKSADEPAHLNTADTASPRNQRFHCRQDLRSPWRRTSAEIEKHDAKLQQMLEQLAALPDQDIDLSNHPERLDWSEAERGQFYRPITQSLIMRVDADVLAWFEGNSKQYQSRINEGLRRLVRQQQKARAAKRYRGFQG